MLLAAVAPRVWAGESGLNVVVVVNQNSSNSVQLGNDYCEQRGVPPQNLFRMTGWTGGNISWQQDDFQNYLLTPLLNMIATRALTNQAEIVLLSMDIPYRVINGDSENSTTSALFYGFKVNTTNAPPNLPDTCSLPDDATNSYSFSELPFNLAQPDTASTNSFLTMMLTDNSLGQAEAALARGVAGDGTFPSQTVYLEKTGDINRSIRFLVFDNAVQECRARSDDAVVRTNSNSTAFADALGLDTGLTFLAFPGDVFVPGAMADNLTSYSGFLFEQTGQTSLLAFMDAGASASYGTVVEPCNYTYKFPDPMAYFYQNRGFCLAESYYQSLADPYQGLLVGEPLSAPFARPGSATWNFPSNGSALGGSASLQVSVSSADTNLPLSQLDLFIDGNFARTITNLPPSEGNVIFASIEGVTASYTVTNGDSLASAAIGLASALTAETNLTGVEAEAVGDRVVMRSQIVTTPGSSIAVQTGTLIGSAPALTTYAAAALPTFLDSTAYGYHFVECSNLVQVGDWLQLSIIKTNGFQATFAVTNAVYGQSITMFLQSLMDEINGDPDLQTADGVTAADMLSGTNGYEGFIIYAGSPGWPAAQIQTVFSGSADLAVIPPGTNSLIDNVRDLQPRSQIYLSCGANSFSAPFSLDTTKFAGGFHDLTAVAYEGTSVRTQTRATETVQFHNTPLSAILSQTGADTNGNLLFDVAANATNITRTELFSTGGSIAVQTNQPMAQLTAPAATLGIGLHPFYAVITDSGDNQYKTQTIWEQLPALQVSGGGSPLTLSWPALIGRSYNVLAATELTGAYQTVGTVAATGAQAQWQITPPPSGAAFYQVSLVK
ncbi:MAG TPA: TIGR03790 family protein [Verrucomicrobiae bacterium]|nr:TIGR03790 family protein [Verrucomicrobiae bacterium]